ncbi:MAG TPA: cytidylate kinase family protein [Methylomirabilota bacterium]|nr:cytidylate kinase family protein [Methylomirabilota bacterium]
MSIVALSEGVGSLGDEIGRAVSRALGYEFADREIIAKAAEEFGESMTELFHVTEERPTWWERLADSKPRYLALVEVVLFEFAARDNVVLSGRGGTILLAQVPHVLRVRVTAPNRVRARRVEHTQGLTNEAAQDLVADSDSERAARIRFLYHVDWADPLLYDLVLNTERISVERGVALICETLGEPRFAPTPDSRRAVLDRALAARARAALLSNPFTRRLRLEAVCHEGVLTVSGTAEDERQRQAVEEILARIPGATRRENEVSVARPPRIPAMRV